MIGISSSRCITFGTVLVPVAVVAGLLIAAPPARAAISPNPIVLENQKPGTSAWQLPWAGMRVADDVGKQIKGYADATSVNIGERLSFKVSVVPAQDYRIHISRLGYYGGAGGRLIMYSTLRHGTTQPRCPLDLKTGVIECNWATPGSSPRSRAG